MSKKLLKKSIDLVEDAETPTKLSKVKKHNLTKTKTVHSNLSRKGKHLEYAVRRCLAISQNNNERIEKNVKNLLQFTKNIIELKNIEKIIKHSEKGEETTQCANKEESIFTEEDFQRFEQEYFLS